MEIINLVQIVWIIKVLKFIKVFRKLYKRKIYYSNKIGFKFYIIN